MCRMVEVAPRAAALRSHGLRRRVDPDAAHPAQVDDKGAIRGPESRDAVSTASNGDRQPFSPRRFRRRDHVRDTLASDDRRGSLVDHRVIDLSSLVVLLVTRPDDFPTNLPLQFDDRLLVQNRSPLLAADLDEAISSF